MQELEKENVINGSRRQNAVAKEPNNLASHRNVEKTVMRDILKNLGCVMENGQFWQSGHEYTQTADKCAPLQLGFYVHE